MGYMSHSWLVYLNVLLTFVLMLSSTAAEAATMSLKGGWRTAEA